jgi:hypothetical protein
MIHQPGDVCRPDGKIKGRKEKVLPQFRQKMPANEISAVKTTGSKE